MCPRQRTAGRLFVGGGCILLTERNWAAPGRRFDEQSAGLGLQLRCSDTRLDAAPPRRSKQREMDVSKRFEVVSLLVQEMSRWTAKVEFRHFRELQATQMRMGFLLRAESRRAQPPFASCGLRGKLFAGVDKAPRNPERAHRVARSPAARGGHSWLLRSTSSCLGRAPGGLAQQL